MTILLRVALVVLALSSCLAHAAVLRPRVAGVHFPMNITPSVSISDGQWLFDLYVILLNRQADETGYRVNFGDLQNGVSRVAIYGAFVASQEFQSNTALWDAGGFVSRAYNTLLHRAAQPNEINNWVSQMTAYNGQGGQGSVTWPQLLNDVYGSQEYHNDCPTQYYTLGAPVTEGEPLLRDLFSGAFRLQIANESQVLTLNLPSAKAVWDQKLLTLPNPMAAVDGYPYMAFTRVYLNPDFTIALMSSLDGVTFNEVDLVFDLQAGQTFYDPHVSVDYSVCPPRYVMSMECIGHGGAASLCTSFTSTPSRAFTWTNPFIVVDGCTGGNPAACGTIAAESASTGVTLHDGYSNYLAWTQVYDGVGPSDPQVHTYSQMAGPVASTTNTYYGTVMGGSTPVLTMMPSVPQPWCTTSWDCNNRDKQDWKREGDMYYVAYNGANYYRCNGKWGISFVRSSTAVGSAYTDYLPISQGISAVLDTTCGASYPTVNVIKGEIRVHYAFRDSNGAPATLSAKLVPN